MKRKELLEARIIKPCNCKICQLFKEKNLESVIYQILNTRFRTRTSFGKVCYWIGCPRSIESTPASFEEIFESLKEDELEDVIYNLNLFRS